MKSQQTEEKILNPDLFPFLAGGMGCLRLIRFQDFSSDTPTLWNNPAKLKKRGSLKKKKDLKTICSSKKNEGLVRVVWPFFFLYWKRKKKCRREGGTANVIFWWLWLNFFFVKKLEIMPLFLDSLFFLVLKKNRQHE